MKINKKINILFLLLLITSYIYSENISFSANSMTGTVGNNSDTTQLSGNAYVITETMEIAADIIKMSGKDFRYINATGSIKGKNLQTQMEFACESLVYDRETKIAELKDNVSMTDIKNNVSAKAQVIEYNQDTEIATMQINVELKQKDNTCTGAYAIYRKNEQILELSGNAQIKQKDDTFRAQEISLNMETQEITLDGRVKGSITDERPSEKQDQDNTENNTEEETEAEKVQETKNDTTLENKETQNTDKSTEQITQETTKEGTN